MKLYHSTTGVGPFISVSVLSVKTLRWYTKRLNDFEAYCKERGITELNQITAATVVRFVDQLTSTNSYTRHGYGQVVKCFLNYYVHDEQAGIEERTVKKIKLVKPEVANIEPLSMDEIQRLLSATERLPFPLRGKALVSLLIDTGVRAKRLHSLFYSFSSWYKSEILTPNERATFSSVSRDGE